MDRGSLRRSWASVTCVAVIAGGLAVLGAPAQAAVPSPLIYGVNPFDNVQNSFGLQPFQLSSGAGVGGEVITVVAGPHAGEVVVGANALAVDPTDSTAYIAVKFSFNFPSPRYLATIDLTNGQATTIGVLSRQIAGFAFRTGGTLYAVSGDGDTQCDACLYEVDKTTAALTLKKDLGTGSNTPCCGEAIGYNPIDDMIYHVSGIAPSETFEKIDPDSSFVQTEIGLTGGSPDEIMGIGFDTASGNFVMTDLDRDVWSVTTGGAVAHASTTDVWLRGVVVGSDVTVLDFGDAPDGIGTPPQNDYPTLAAGTGASHVPIGPRLGFLRDAELDGLPSVDADGDDTDGNDDEDGIVFRNHLERGLETAVKIRGTPSAELDAWIDFNRDGDWEDSGESVIGASLGPTSETQFTFAVPSNASLGVTYARFRISSTGLLTPFGDANDGEVEDYAVEIKDPVPGAQFRCGQEVTGKVVLDIDLIGCPEHGLVATGKSAKIDLNGHTFTGVGIGGGIHVPGLTKLKLVGNLGSIANFSAGVSIDDCDSKGSSVSGVEVDDSTLDGIFACGTAHKIQENDVDGSGRNGIRVAGGRHTVTGNLVNDSATDGIRQSSNGQRVKVLENVVSDSGDDGIDINTELAKVIGNDMTNSFDDGLIVNFGTDDPGIKGKDNDTHGDPCFPSRVCV